MNTRWIYWHFKKAIKNKDRKKIISMASKKGYIEATTLSKDNKSERNPKARDTDVSFSSDKYLYNLICPFVVEANKSAEWIFDIDWYEDVQIAKYKKNQHYDWHNDGRSDNSGKYGKDAGNFANKVRKLSLVAILSNGYSGGEFLIKSPYSDEPEKPDLGVGDIIVFPSYLQHTSNPVTKGTKYSLAMWCLGPPFR